MTTKNHKKIPSMQRVNIQSKYLQRSQRNEQSDQGVKFVVHSSWTVQWTWSSFRNIKEFKDILVSEFLG